MTKLLQESLGCSRIVFSYRSMGSLFSLRHIGRHILNCACCATLPGATTSSVFVLSSATTSSVFYPRVVHALRPAAEEGSFRADRFPRRRCCLTLTVPVLGVEPFPLVPREQNRGGGPIGVAREGKIRGSRVLWRVLGLGTG